MNKESVSILPCPIAAKALAVPITLTLSEEVEVEDGKLFMYENAQRSESVKIVKSAPCHDTKSFDDD
ncbi:hypothetical protein Y788_04815 [Pantoea dispersa 625]|nr:hypothetical protein Y788_04815 [Pantoea dispersa 625]